MRFRPFAIGSVWGVCFESKSALTPTFQPNPQQNINRQFRGKTWNCFFIPHHLIKSNFFDIKFHPKKVFGELSYWHAFNGYNKVPFLQSVKNHPKFHKSCWMAVEAPRLLLEWHLHPWDDFNLTHHFHWIYTPLPLNLHVHWISKASPSFLKKFAAF